MQLIIIHKPKCSLASKNSNLLRNALSSELIAEIILNEFTTNCIFKDNPNSTIAIPEKWKVKHSPKDITILPYDKTIPINLNGEKQTKMPHWFTLLNGRFVTNVNSQEISKILTHQDADMVAINADPALLPYQEHVKITSQGNIAGFRRLYYDSVLPESVLTNWPHQLFVKHSALKKILETGPLPLAFDNFVDRCKSKSMTFHSCRIGGTVLDLETEAGLLKFLTAGLNSTPSNPHHTNLYCHAGHIQNCKISDSTRFFGKVAIGSNVQIDDNAIIVGPTILSDNAKIAKKAVIRTSVIGPDLSIPYNKFVQGQILIGQKSQRKLFSNNRSTSNTLNTTLNKIESKNNFRHWPQFSYPKLPKRIADITLSLAVLVLSFPVLAIIAIAVKLSSPGPVFFKHKRQGLHGKAFSCLKFRTMIIDADKIQDKLRFNNQVDGPQFKMQRDPRITATGKFLRNTFIDEIPQFINVLLGQMSIVGPRPSPKKENSLCPFWRDARLSVRPGITGLWQIHRTRQPSHDFQEWIYYDTKYVRELSLSLDLLICWKTVKKIINNFLDQF